MVKKSSHLKANFVLGECSSALFWKEQSGLFQLDRQSQEAPEMQGGHCSWDKVTTKSLMAMALHLQDFLF